MARAGEARIILPEGWSLEVEERDVLMLLFLKSFTTAASDDKTGPDRLTETYKHLLSEGFNW